MDTPVGLAMPALHLRDTKQTLAMTPEKTSTRPMVMDRRVSSPPVSPASQNYRYRDQQFQRFQPSIVQDLLTPPSSPAVQEDQKPTFTEIESPSRPRSLLGRFQIPDLRPSIDSFVQNRPTDLDTPPEESSLIQYPYELEILRDSTGKSVEFGAGAWSTVYKAISHPPSRTIEEQTSPTQYARSPWSPLIVAVKAPHRSDARTIIQSEARILSHLTRTRHAEEHIVPFHGYIPSTGSIVMSAMPLSLADHISDRASEMRSMYMRYAKTSPVVGSEAIWLSLATQLIDSLHWLHDVAGVVHGDIKPHNILLQPQSPTSSASDDSYYQLSTTCSNSLPPSTASTTQFPFTAVLTDFSSSSPIAGPRSPGALSAITPQYTAPELLKSSVLRNPATVPTPSADVFSLAVTLLACSTGDLNVYPSTNPLQRQAMASQGWGVLNFARSSSDTMTMMRCPRFGIVEQVLERAVLKDGMGRVDAGTWRMIVREKAERLRDGGDPVKKT